MIFLATFEYPTHAMRILFSGILFFISISGYSQKNLIPTPSFEQEISFDKINDSQFWNKCMKNDTPDQFRFYSNSKKNKEYSEYICGPKPIEGNAYLGIFCYRTNPVRGIYNIRETVQVKLLEKLTKDSIYTLTVYAALDPESTHAIKNLQIAFSPSLSTFKNEKALFKTYTQIKFKDQWLSDTSWMKLEYVYKARGNEQYLMIGNFLKDGSTIKKPMNFSDQGSRTKKWNLYEKETAAYYYFDALSLRKNAQRSQSTKKPDAPSPPEVCPPIPDEDEELNEITIEEVEKDSVFILEKIFFEFDKAELLPESLYELMRLLNFMNTYTEVNILIEGHTDQVGTYEYNIDLSNKRAWAVKDFLLDQGINKSRMKTVGYGFTKPLVEENDKNNIGINRRVAFSIIQE